MISALGCFPSSTASQLPYARISVNRHLYAQHRELPTNVLARYKWLWAAPTHQRRQSIDEKARPILRSPCHLIDLITRGLLHHRRLFICLLYPLCRRGLLLPMILVVILGFATTDNPFIHFLRAISRSGSKIQLLNTPVNVKIIEMEADKIKTTIIETDQVIILASRTDQAIPTATKIDQITTTAVCQMETLFEIAETLDGAGVPFEAAVRR